MKQSDYTVYTYGSIPDDVAPKIASSLELSDLSSLNCCSRVWREIWSSDCLWETLFKERWPPFYEDILKDPNFKLCNGNFQGWKELYIKQHKEMKDKAESVSEFVGQYLKSESLEVNDHLKAVNYLKSLRFGFKDVRMYLFKPEMNVFVYLVGLHYCLDILQVPVSDVAEALESSKISETIVCVKWWKLGRWSHGFRMRDEFHSRCISLEDIATSKDDGDVLGILHRGAVHEVLQAQIAIVNFKNDTWPVIIRR